MLQSQNECIFTKNTMHLTVFTVFSWIKVTFSTVSQLCWNLCCIWLVDVFSALHYTELYFCTFCRCLCDFCVSGAFAGVLIPVALIQFHLQLQHSQANTIITSSRISRQHFFTIVICFPRKFEVTLWNLLWSIFLQRQACLPATLLVSVNPWGVAFVKTSTLGFFYFYSWLPLEATVFVTHLKTVYRTAS